MNITVYASETIDADTLGAGLAVMAAMHGDKDFPENFTAHPAIAHADREGDAIRFTPDFAGLTAPLSLTLHKNGTDTAQISLPEGDAAYKVLKQSLSGKAGTGTSPKTPSPKN